MKTKEELRISIYKKYYFANHLIVFIICTEILSFIIASVSVYYSTNANILHLYLFNIVGGFIIGLVTLWRISATIDIREKRRDLLSEIELKTIEISKITKSIENDPGNYTEKEIKKFKKILKLKEKNQELEVEYDMIMIA